MSKKVGIFKKYASLILILTLILNVFVGTFGYAQNNENNLQNEQVKGQITISLEKFTLGTGYVKEPLKVSFDEGDKLSNVIVKFLGEGNYKNGGNVEEGFYITDIYDHNNTPTNIPEYILEKAGVLKHVDKNNKWIGEKDYTEQSGWLYTVGNESAEVGMSGYDPVDGDVVRLQYSVHGYGSDIGTGWEENYVNQADKDNLTSKIAEINSNLDKEKLLANEGVNAAYKNAYTKLSNLESTQSSIDQALKQLNDSLKILEEDNNILEKYKDENKMSHWSREEIKKATEKNIISGNNGYFRPQDDITRAEFTKIIVSALNLDIDKNENNIFEDIKKTNWFYPYATAAYKAGIVEGSGNNFKPDDNITREEMATIIVRALKLSHKKPNTNIKDMNKVSIWAKESVETAIATGLMKGTGDNFNPQSKATREMATVVAMRGLDYEPETPEVPTDENIDLTKEIKTTAKFMRETVTDPAVGTIGGEWTVLGLARSGEVISNNYYENYYENVVNSVKELMPEDNSKPEGVLHRHKGTEHSRIILGLTSIGKDITNVGGYDISKAIADFNYITKQGINGPIFALIALDSNNYEIPQVASVETQTTREMLIDFILGREIDGGGWALGENAKVADPDITGMAIQGLTPYYNSNSNVKEAVDRGLSWLSKTQREEGGYTSWGSVNSESTSQVIVALAGLGIDPHNDERFIKNGKSAVDSLLSFRVENGGFYHVKAGGTSNGGGNPGEIDLMATDQSMYAMIAYDRFVNEQTRLYDMTDVKK